LVVLIALGRNISQAGVALFLHASLEGFQVFIMLKNTLIAMARLLKVLPLLFVVAACTSIGPLNIGQDRMKYNEAMQKTNDQELLINLVRLRYLDSPSFVSVSGITAQSSLITGMSLSMARTTSRVSGVRTLGFSDTFAPSVTVTDAPVISYTPLQGDGFVRELLSPISLDLVVLLSKSGWDIRGVLNLLVERMNFVPNAPSASGPTPQMPPEYKEFANLLTNIGKMGNDVSLDYFVTGKEILPGIRFAPGALETPHGKAVEKQLKLAPGKEMFFLSNNIDVDRKDIIEMRTRSLMGVLYFLSHSVNIPQDDADGGFVVVTDDANGDEFYWPAVSNNMFHVLTSKDEPANAAVQVLYNGSWFYIANNDLRTKSSFILLSQLMDLQSGNQALTAPALTLPLN
jgi:hypothetical protein